MKPYVITSPPWETTSGGVRVMYGLYGWLLAKGQVAFLNQKPTSGDAIAIYPEIQRGNPVEASTVVRYILNKPGVVPALMSDGSIVHGQTEFPETDKMYYFSRIFGKAQDANHYLFLPILNLHIFKDQKKQRTKTAYFVGKGVNYPGTIDEFVLPEGSILIDRVFAQDQQALADLLNECEALYCYDPVTAMTEIARLCGCRVVMVNPVYTLDEFKFYEPAMDGISWGIDQGMELHVDAFRTHYLSLIEEFERKLDLFIDETQS